MRTNRRLARLRWNMTIFLQTHTPEETAEWVRDELKIKPEDVRMWLIRDAAKPFKKRGMYSNGGKGLRFPKKSDMIASCTKREGDD